MCAYLDQNRKMKALKYVISVINVIVCRNINVAYTNININIADVCERVSALIMFK